MNLGPGDLGSRLESVVVTRSCQDARRRRGDEGGASAADGWRDATGQRNGSAWASSSSRGRVLAAQTLPDAAKPFA